jgi:hypothetical protein
MVYPNGTIKFQQDQSYIHNSRVVQEWLSLPAEVEITDWLQRAPDMNHIESMLNEVKRTMRETWPVLPSRNSDEFEPSNRQIKFVSALRSINY